MYMTIIADQGTHLLIGQKDRFAVIERRNGRFYNCHDERREGIAPDELSAVSKILNDSDWTD